MMVLLNENGYVDSYAMVGNLVGGIEVPDPEDADHFERHFEAYSFGNGKISFNDARENELVMLRQISEIRIRRETECYPIVNRGLLWYESLTIKQKLELSKWYQAWLNAPSTLTIPERPDWLEE